MSNDHIHKAYRPDLEAGWTSRTDVFTGGVDDSTAWYLFMESDSRFLAYVTPSAPPL